MDNSQASSLVNLDFAAMVVCEEDGDWGKEERKTKPYAIA